MSGINNVSLNNAVTGVIQEQLKAAENSQKKVSEETSSDNTAANPVDTVELSARAQSLLNKVSAAGDSPESAMQTKQESSAGQEISPKTSEKEQSAETAAASKAEVKQGPKPAPVMAEASSSDEEEEEETSSTTNLVSLSESKLLEMVMEGSISRADMESELARRGIAAE